MKRQFWSGCGALAAGVILAVAPYCQEREIARVARSYGANVTDAEVRNNPLTKVYLCQRYGGDNRLKGSCGAYSPELYGR